MENLEQTAQQLTAAQTAQQLTTAQTARCNYLPAQLQHIIMTVHQTAPHFLTVIVLEKIWRWQNL
jgi:hypothetical protein